MMSILAAVLSADPVYFCFFCGKVRVSHPMDCCASCGKQRRGKAVAW